MSTRELSRRNLLGMAAGALSSAAAGARAQTKAAAAASRIQYGEPFRLAGKRLYFQNWFYIRPGRFEWRDDNGRKVDLTDETAPSAAHLEHFGQPWGIRLAAQPAQRIDPFFHGERPWEQEGGVSLNCIIQEQGIFRGWGGHFARQKQNDPPRPFSFYMESSDGLTWKRPNLGLVEFDGSRANNLISFENGGTPFIDPSAPPAERYKAVGMSDLADDVVKEYFRKRPNELDPRADRHSDGSLTGLTGAVSPDGLRWTNFREPLVVVFSDTQIIGYYDEELNRYVVYTRAWEVGPRSRRVPDSRSDLFEIGRRSIGRTESADFRRFPVHETIIEPGPQFLPTDALYTNCKTTMPGAPDHHLFFPTVWHTATDSTSITLASSNDGKVWQFVPGAPVFETGVFGAFDGGAVFAHPNLLELPDGRFALPYTGYNVPHKYPRGQYKFALGYATWPKGRLIALEAPSRGEFTTMAILPPARRLRINALTLRAGRIQVEVADAQGRPLPGRSFAQAAPVFGDHHWTPLTWAGSEDLGHKDGQAISLRFRMEQAQLFGLEFA